MSYKITDTIVVDQNKNIGSIGIATFAGPVLIGGGTSTGTVSQPLQVTGSNGAYIGGNLGIGSTNPSSKLWVSGDVRIVGIHTAQVLSASNDPGTGIATDFTNSLFGNGWRVSSPGSTTYFKLATLPNGGGGNTFDHLTINGVLGAWTNGNQTPFEITFANRGAFNYKYVSYGSVRSDVKIIGISTNSTVEIWAQHQASQFTKLVYNIANSIQSIVVSNPTSTTTAPVGTTVFDSSTVTPRFIINESDNVGIGTATPTSKLQVVGDASVSGLTTTNNLYVAGVSTFINGPILVGTASSTGTASQPLQVTGGAYVSGNLGIGTTAPLQKLHVLGNLLVAAGSSTGQHITQKAYELNSGTLSWEGSAGQLFSITNNLTSGSIFSVNDVSGIPSIDVDANGTISLGAFGGNIGIGTTSATSKLSVVGDGRFTGVLTATTFSGTLSGYASSAGISTNLNGGLAGNIVYQSGPNTTTFLANGTSNYILQSNGVGNAPSWVPAAPSGAVTGLVIRDSSNNIVGTSGSITQLTFSSGLSVTGTTGAAGIATITLSSNIVGSALSISGISTFTNPNANALNIRSGASGSYTSFNIGRTSADGTFAVAGAGAQFAIDAAAGDVVIRTESAAAKLLFTNGGTNSTLAVAGNNVLVGTVSSTGTSSQVLQVNGGAYVSGNLGIGTTNPSNRLTVYGTQSDTVPILSLLSGNQQVGFNNGAQIAFGYDGTPTYQHFIQTRHNATNSNNAIDFYVCDGTNTNTLTSGSVHTMSLVSGSVGINTTNPGATLNVVPTATSIAGLFSGTTSSDMVRITQLGSGNALVVEDETPEGSPFVVTGVGTVGIGITNPSIKLTVNGGLDSSNRQVRFVQSGAGDLYIKHANLVSSIEAGSGVQLALGGNGAEGVRINSTGVGIGTTNPTSKLAVQGDGYFSGVVTATSFSGNASSASYASTAGVSTTLTATASVNTSGIITASSFSGSGANLTSLNASNLSSGIVPSARITASSGDFTVGQNLNVTGNISVGGTSVILNAATLQIKDKDIVLGITTNASNQDVSTDITANHGGVAIASTEGTPLIDINGGVGTDSIPNTYKQIMWLKSGSWTGLSTDAWLFNYGVGIGSTQVPNGVRLAVGGVQFTENDLAVVRNINASGVVTATSFSGNASSATYATYAGFSTSAGVSTSVIGGIGSITQLQVTGISTFTNGPVFIGSGTSTGTSSQPLQVTGGAYVSGSVGIGTILPSYKLDVLGQARVAGDFHISGGSVIDGVGQDLFLQGNSGYGIIFRTNGANERGRFNSTGNLLIATTSDTGTSSQRLQVTGGAYVSGNLGIGNTNPQRKLHLRATNADGIFLDGSDQTGNSGAPTLRVRGQRSDGNASQSFSGQLVLEKWRMDGSINSGQNLGAIIFGGNYDTLPGITTGMTYGASIGAMAEGTFSGIGTAPTAIVFNTGTVGLGTITLANATYGTEAARITSNRNLLIGAITETGTASQPLQVTGSAYVSGSVGIGTTNPSVRLELPGITTNTADFKIGEFFVQNYGLNNSFFGNNGPYNGQAHIRQKTGTAEFFQFLNGKFSIRLYPSAGAGTSLPNKSNLFLNDSGEFGIGSSITTQFGSDYYGATFYHSSQGLVGIGTINPGATLNVVPTATSIAGLFSGTTSSDMVRITQLGTGNALVVEDSANPDSNPFVVSGDGSVGVGTTNPQYKLHVIGSFAATTKSFVIDHPTKEGMKLRHGSLEGPENGVYVRGRSQNDVINLPDYWTGLVDETSITVNLTPIGESATPRVKEIMNNQVMVFSKEEGELDYFYTVYAERVDVEKLEVEF